MRGGWLVALCLVCPVGCGAEIGGDSEADGAPRPDGSPGGAADAATDAALAVETTVFAVPDLVDTFLQLNNPTFNFGGRPRMCADTTTDDRRILLRIDVAALPAGAQVLDASLHIWTGALSNDLSGQIFSLYELLEAWDEGDLDGAAGAASWQERTPGVAWTVAGAGIGSRADTVVGSFTPDAIDTEYVVALEPSLVAGWVADPDSNHGVAIVAAGADGGCFATTENATAGKHPTLVVRWAAP